MTLGLLARVRFLGARPRWPRAVVSRRRGARRVLAFGLLFVLAAMAGMSVALETVKPEWRDPEFGHRIVQLRQLQREAPGRPLVLVLGTSRAQNAFDPAAMEFPDERGSPLVFNFGQTGSPPLKVLLTFSRIIDSGIRPSAIIVEAIPVWLGADGPAEEQLRDVGPRLSAGDLRRLTPYCADPAVLRWRWLEARMAPWHAQRVVLMSHWSPRWLPWGERIDSQWDGMEPDGFVPFPRQFASPEHRAMATAHARREYAGAFDGFRLADGSVRALRDLVARCRAEEIPIAFVEPPVSPIFRGWFHPGAWASGVERFQAFTHDLGVERFPPFEGLVDSDFIDGHHMLKHGAEQYSRWLADTHLKPWLVRQGVAR
jgi:hypothetical protein